MKSQFFSLEGYAHSMLFSLCEYPWEAFLHLENYLRSFQLEAVQPHLFPHVHFINPESIFIGEGTQIEPGAYIQGPCVIGKNCRIRHGAYIRGFCLTGDHCVIGHNTEVKNSIFLNSVCAAHFNYVGDSILGNGVNLGAGVKCANLRLDRKSVRVDLGYEKIDTGLVKLGAILGDFSHVGCNCVINPGTLLGRNSVCFPCLNIQGFIPEKGVVKSAIKNSVE